MGSRKIHRLLGLLMMLPLLAWATTGVIFLTKPGYEGAYERLLVKTYDVESDTGFSVPGGWEELRIIRSVLGLHLLVKTDGAFKHYNPETLLPSALPGEAEVRKLISDAIGVNPERYGVLDRVDGLNAYTSTGVVINLNWDEMKLSQRGMDRRVIETLYKIHYLQWTKWESLNLLLGVVGLFCLAAVTMIGCCAYVLRMREKAEQTHLK